jgi:hypothetical protein
METKVKKYSIGLIAIIFTILVGCSKSSDNTVTPTNTQGTISGIITDASTNQPITGITVTNSQSSQSAVTDAKGAYSFSVAVGTYTVSIADAGYKAATLSVTVTAGNTSAGNLSITPFFWKKPKTNGNATYAIRTTANPTIDGTALQAGDLVGAFYDSTGTGILGCAGYSSWTVSSNIAVTVWGDDNTTTEKEGFASGDAIQWKIKRSSDGKVFNATATYESGTGAYSANGTIILSSLKAVSK